MCFVLLGLCERCEAAAGLETLAVRPGVATLSVEGTGAQEGGSGRTQHTQLLWVLTA